MIDCVELVAIRGASYAAAGNLSSQHKIARLGSHTSLVQNKNFCPGCASVTPRTSKEFSAAGCSVFGPRSLAI